MRVLVTGGGGFIGSNLVQALLLRGDDVRVIDDFSTGQRENLSEAPEWASDGRASFELIEADICNETATHDAVRGCDAVLHLAAIPSVVRSVADPVASHRTNVDGTLSLLVAARDAKVGRFVVASSSSIYGDSETLPKIETMPPRPISPYGLDKYAAETYCCLFSRLYGLGTIALRYFNVFGPRQDPTSEYSAVIPKFVGALLQGRPPTIYGNGEQSRDFTFIENVVQANMLALEADDRACGEMYNIACGDRITLLELAAMLGAKLGRSITPEHAPPRAGDIMHSLADISKAKSLLGYDPAVGMDEGLSRTIEWFEKEFGASTRTA